MLSGSVLAFFLHLTLGISFGHCLRKDFMLGAVSMAAVMSEELASVKATHFAVCVCLHFTGNYLTVSMYDSVSALTLYCGV